MAKKKKYGISDENIATLLRLYLATSDKSLGILHLLTGVPYGQLKSVIRSLPAEFGLYKNTNGTLIVKYFQGAAGTEQAWTGHGRQHGPKGDFYCGVCKQSFNSEYALQQHNGSARHRVNLLAQQLKSSGSFHANLQGLQVSEFEEGLTLALNEPKVLSLVVENVGSITHTIKSACQVRSLPDVRVLSEFGPHGVSLPPGHQLEVQVEVTPRSYGFICTLIMLDFGFVIARELRVECDPFGNDTDLPDISSKGPYQKRKMRNLLPVNPRDFVPGEREQRPRMPWKNPPRQHTVPKRLREMVALGKTDELQAELDKFKQQPDDLRNHLEKLHTLLHLEELQQEVDVRSYDMQGAKLFLSGRYLALKVPGLAEARPSVLRGDALYVSRADGTDGGKEWQGMVHIVRQEEVLMRFDPRFHRSFIAGLTYNIRFSIKRTSFVFMHEAVEVARGGAVAGLRTELLKPPADARRVLGNAVRVKNWINSSIGGNPEQAEAVRCIVQGSSGQLPFIIWGPPGTGKTSTLVEAATQVLRLLPESRVLLVAPSNLAADLLAQRLLGSGRPKLEMLRVCAFSRPKQDLLTGLEDVTLWDDATLAFQLPSLQQVTAIEVRVVVVTALMAAKLHALGVPAGHFTHVMFDEAGQAEEPLALCAMAGLAGVNTQVVLAGDPKQLGPVIHSGPAKQAGLGLSLLERLTSVAPYAAVVNGDGSSSGINGSNGSSSSSGDGLIVKLVRNYRSHPKLLQLPSELFYQGELQACASPEITHTLLHWDKLPNKTFPTIFHSIVGKDEQEQNSPSWFNTQEAKLVLKYVEELMSMRGRNRVTANQIGIITPYRRQVQRIRTLLTGRGYGSVQVGSVEQLQGQERRIIIISTVRSSVDFLSHDLKHKLGFVANAKRFNVAITRTQALMIVIGNPEVLMNDKHWLALLMNCQQHGACVGQPMPDLSAAADAAATATGGASGSSQQQTGSGGATGQGRAANGAGRDAVSSSLDQQIVQLEKLMTSIKFSQAVDEAAQQQLLLLEGQQLLEFSGLVDEAGGGMVRHE